MYAALFIGIVVAGIFSYDMGRRLWLQKAWQRSSNRGDGEQAQSRVTDRRGAGGDRRRSHAGVAEFRGFIPRLRESDQK